LEEDLKDCKQLFYIMNRIDSEKCPLFGLEEDDLLKRADILLNNSKALGCREVVGQKDLTTGN